MFSEKLRSLRTSKNMTKKEVADRLFISPNAYAKWESGETRIKVEDIDKLSEIFEVDPGYFLGSTYVNCHNTSGSNAVFYGEMNNYFPGEKELHQKLLAAKDAVIEAQEKNIRSLEMRITKLEDDLNQLKPKSTQQPDFGK